jgi:hypothetical protein
MLTEDEWDKISSTPGLSEDFIRENSDKVNWQYISRYQKLIEEFIREFSDKLYWWEISSYQKLSEDFIREISDKVYFDLISKYQKLSENFIREFSDKVNWINISKFQKLSEEFIIENSDKVNRYNIFKYQKLGKDLIKKYNTNIHIPETNWLYKDKEYKKKYIKENTEHEIIGDKVIAYKSCRKDGYSAFNFQYHYEVGGEYECHSDYNVDEENSFGLSAWTKEKALSYYDRGKLFKVEIDLENIAAVVQDENKIRASKIKILEEVSF